MGPGSRSEGPGGYQRPTKRARTGGRGRGRGKARGRGRKSAGPQAFVPEVVKIDKASALRLKGKQITGTDRMGGGYRMARASHGTDSGCWYYEVHIDKDKVASTDAAYRVGFAHKKADLQGPCGMDRYSFGYRNIEGSLVHASHRVDQANEPYKAGDIIGCLINFQSDELEDIESDHPADDSAFPKDPKKPQGNYVRYFRNGRDQGVAFENIPPGAYRAAASVFRTGTFRLNFGPRFKCWPMPPGLAARLPEAERTAKPVCELVPPLDTQRAVHAIAQARAAELARIEQARAEAEEKKAAEVKAQKDALKNARRNARRGATSGN